MSAFNNLKISVSGIRGLAPEQLSSKVVYSLVRAFAENIIGDYILISRDSRASGLELEKAVKQALVDAGKKILDADLIPLPTTQIVIQSLAASGGIDITASHNPIEYNGLKFLNANGRFISQELLDLIVQQAEKYLLSDYSVQQLSGEDVQEKAIQSHLQKLQPLFSTGRRLIVAVDAVNGAGSYIVPRLIELMGCDSLLIANNPNQPFPRVPEPTPKNLVWTQEQLRGKKYDLCVVVDPDADRLTLIDENGTLLSEEYTLPLIAGNFVLANHEGVIVVNQSTSQMIDAVTANCNIKVVRSAVGEFNVVSAMEKYRAFFGGEGNGGIIDPAVNLGRDSLVGIVHIINRLRQSNKKLSKLVRELPIFVMRKEKIDASSITDIKEFFNKLIMMYPEALAEKEDGLRLSWPNERKWLHLRPSNTEPIFRIIGEARTGKEIDDLIKSVQSIIN